MLHTSQIYTQIYLIYVLGHLIIGKKFSNLPHVSRYFLDQRGFIYVKADIWTMLCILTLFYFFWIWVFDAVYLRRGEIHTLPLYSEFITL